MSKVQHVPKGKSYDYPDDATAEDRCKQAVEQSDGRLKYRKAKDGSFVIERAAKPAALEE